MILNEFPTIEEFYKTYWGKKPFVVRNAINKDVFEQLIDGDTLAGLSLEEDIKSRIVITKPQENSGTDKWKCHHGPFNEEMFSNLGDKNWSLLVQNVEQYHAGTANLLRSFNFSPRWLMDDIMVSYSTVGGSVGPHTDSYHVFLVQGTGRRKWTIGTSPIENGECIENLDLKIMKAGVEGEEIEVSIGDVLYIPPHFAHEGITIENALTYSVGFLGPKLSEMFVEYGHYLEQIDQMNKRYSGQGLEADSASFTISPKAQKAVQNDLIDTIKSNDFSIWLAEYFSTPTHDDVENIEKREKQLSSTQLLQQLNEENNLYRPENIKLSISTFSNGGINLAIYGEIVPTTSAHDQLIHWLNQNNIISMEDIQTFAKAQDNLNELMKLVTHLYNQNILFFENEDITQA